MGHERCVDLGHQRGAHLGGGDDRIDLFNQAEMKTQFGQYFLAGIFQNFFNIVLLRFNQQIIDLYHNIIILLVHEIRLAESL